MKMTKKELASARREGESHRRAGYKLSENPYRLIFGAESFADPREAEWEAGWRAANQKLKAA
jgi:hypothetical protein